MCEAVREFMSQGYSRMAAAGHIGVSYDAFREYQERHPEFRQAVKFGQAVRTMKLEEDLLTADSGPRATTRIFALKNAAPEEWRDKIDNTHSAPDGGPVKNENKLTIEYVRPDQDT